MIENRWNEDDARCWQDAAGDDPATRELALRVYSSRLIGSEPDLVMHGGGNTSVKLTARDVYGDKVEVLHVKGSGWDLDTIEAAGLPVLEGLTITARTVSNRALRRATEQMAEAVREGGGLSAAMRRAEVFPPILVYMTASGESSGRLEPMLERAADYLEREFSNFTAVMLSLLEPAIIVSSGPLRVR